MHSPEYKHTCKLKQRQNMQSLHNKYIQKYKNSTLQNKKCFMLTIISFFKK